MTRPALRRTVAGPGAPVTGMLAWSLGGTVLAAAGQWVAIVALARVGTPGMVGQYALGLALGAPVVLLAGLGMRTAQITDPDPEFRFGDYLRLRIAGMAVALAVIVVVAPLLAPGGAAVVVLVGFAKALDGIGDIYLGLFQRHDRMRLIALSLGANGVLTAVALCLLPVLGSLVWATAGSVVASAVTSVGFCVWAARPLRGTDTGSADAAPTLARLRRLFVVTLPLGVAYGCSSLTANVPRYVVAHELGPAPLGVFAALGYVVVGATVVFGAITQVVLPRMARMHAAGDLGGVLRLTRGLCAGTLASGVVVVPAVAVLGPAALGVLYGPAYARNAPILTLLTVAALLGGVVFFLNAALSATRRFGNQLAVNAAALVFAVAAAAVLVPWLELAGAAWAVVVTMAGEGALKAVLLRRVRNPSSRVTRPVRSPEV
ncbi:lipopolysaccharide biosynthesis protein [Pseudosporangium ferrugineum]|uniref:O-antigen/teichoic acid export membrane protein n=1 Tax=Pseudosporangium ferrugineum TaxID=439699 RepID=A0A2T0S3D0_9ACTN|nr:lipopolysaccharide biosynthesis protein [Pseudosporangium ferrugineum]PRY27919.1 O-antigen/teichoic acid export membrane protein [Pseudosporangium ferrugineum]